jgi:hypothetical protein
VGAHDAGQGPVHIWLNSIVVLYDVFDELRVLVLEVAEVTEVDVHGLLLILRHLLSILCIVFQWLILVAIHEHVLQLLVVFVIRPEFVAEKRKKCDQNKSNFNQYWLASKRVWQCSLNLPGQELIEVVLHFLGDRVSVAVEYFIIVVDDASVHHVLSHLLKFCGNLIMYKNSNEMKVKH